MSESLADRLDVYSQVAMGAEVLAPVALMHEAAAALRAQQWMGAIGEHLLIVTPYYPESEWSGEPDTTIVLFEINTEERNEQCLESLSWMKSDLGEAVAEAVANLPPPAPTEQL